MSQELRDLVNYTHHASSDEEDNRADAGTVFCTSTTCLTRRKIIVEARHYCSPSLFLTAPRLPLQRRAAWNACASSTDYP